MANPDDYFGADSGKPEAKPREKRPVNPDDYFGPVEPAKPKAEKQPGLIKRGLAALSTPAPSDAPRDGARRGGTTAELRQGAFGADEPAAEESAAGAGRGFVNPDVVRSDGRRGGTPAALREGAYVAGTVEPPAPTPTAGELLETPRADFQPSQADLEWQSLSPAKQQEILALKARRGSPGAVASEPGVAETIAANVRDFTTNPLARGAVAGFSQLGQTGVGAVRAVADTVGADGVADFAAGASGKATQIGAGATRDLKGNDKLAADIFSSILNSAPSLAVGMAGGDPLRTLFAQSALAEYNSGRDAGFSPAESAIRAGIMGLAEALGERFGLPQQIALLKSVAKHVPTGELAKTFGSMIAREIPGEQLTTAMQFLADKLGPAALNPNASLADYLNQAGETLKVTIGQTAVMGGGPAAIGTVRDTYSKANRTTAAPEQILAQAIDQAAAQFGLNTKAAATLREKIASMDPDAATNYAEKLFAAAERAGLVKKPGGGSAVRQNAKDLAAKAAKDAEAQQGDASGDSVPAGAAASSDTGLADELDAGAILGTQAEAPQAASGEAPTEGATDGPMTDEPAQPGVEAGAAPPIEGDLTTGDGQPYGTKASARARATRDGGDVVEVLGGWIVRQSQPSNTRGTNAGDINAVSGTGSGPQPGAGGNAQPGSADASGSGGTVDVVQGELPQPGAAGTAGAVVPGADAGNRPAATGPGAGNEALTARGVMAQVDAVNAEWKDLYRDAHPYFSGDGPTRKLSPSAPQEIKDRYDAFKRNKAEAERNLKALDAPPAAAPTLTAGQSVTVDGKPYTVKSAKPKVLVLTGADGKPRTITSDSATWAKVKPAEPNSVSDKPNSGTGPRILGKIGRTPNAAETVELRPNKDGTLTPHQGKYAMVDYETGEPVVIPGDSTNEQAIDAIKKSGAMGAKDKWFGVQKEQPDVVQGRAPVAQAQPDQKGTPAGGVEPAGAAAAPAVPAAGSAPVEADGVKPTGPVIQNRDRSTPAAITQMRGIAGNPDYLRLSSSRDFTAGAPVIVGSIPLAQMGRKETMAAGKRRIPGVYAVVEAAELVASNSVDGSANPAFEKAATKVIAGNGRTAGLQEAYRTGKAGNYRSELEADESHGINPDVIRGMKAPVLVRVMPASEITDDIGDISNTQAGLQLSAVEQARNDANRVNLDALEFTEDGRITPDTVRRFVQAMPQAEQGNLINRDGSPTTQAVDRLNAVVFFKAYNSEPLTNLYAQTADPDARNIMSALAQAATSMARLEGAGALDIRPLIAEAAEIAINGRRNGLKLSEIAAQDRLDADPDTRVILNLFASNANKVKPVAEALKRAADFAYSEANKPADDMFGSVSQANRGDVVSQIGPRDEARGAQNLEEPAGGKPAGRDAEGQSPEGPGQGNAGAAEEGASAGQAEGLTPAERRKLEAEYQTRATEVLQEVDRRGDLKKLFRSFAGVRTIDGFTELAIDEQASAYADYIEAGAKPVSFSESYTEKVTRMERDALVRRLQSDNEVRQSSGKPFKTEGSAKAFQREHDLAITHEPRAVDGGFVLRLRPPAAQAESRRAEAGLPSYAEAQSAVAAEMGIGETPDGELDATDEQFAEMDRRIAARMRGEAPPLSLTAESEADAQAKAKEIGELIGGMVEDGAKAGTLTEAQARQRFNWQDMGTKDGTKTHALFFSDPADDRPMRYGEVSLFSGSTRFQVDGGESAATLKLAKAESERVAIARLERDGYVGKAPQATAETVPAEPVSQEESESPATVAQQADEANDRDHFTLERMNQQTGQMEPVTFARGEWVRAAMIGSNNSSHGEIDGISHARREFSVDGLWHVFGAAYKAERPVPAAKKTVPLSSVVDAVNNRFGAGLGPADAVSIVDAFKGTMNELYDGTASIEDYRKAYQRVRDAVAVKAELGKLKKDDLIRTFGIMARPDEKKDSLVASAYKSMLRAFSLGKEFGPRSYMMTLGGLENYERQQAEALDAIVEGHTADDLAAYAAEIKVRREERAAQRAAVKESIENPKTLDEYRQFMSFHVRDGKTTNEVRLALLTPEQRAEFDLLLAEESRGRRKATTDDQRSQVRVAGQTVDGEIIATKHTRDGHDLYVVRLVERVSTEDYQTLLAGAKRIGGSYSSFRGNGAVPGFQFRTRDAAEAFQKLAQGDNAAAIEAAKDRRDAFQDDRSQTVSERLIEMADRLEDRADESLGRERKANTARRASFAASAEAAAQGDKAMAKTMRNIASAITSGTAKFLDRVRQKTQVEMLQGFVRTAKDAEIRAKHQSYVDQERHKGERPTGETADYAEFPTFTVYRSDLASLGRQLQEVDGTKKLGDRLMKVADDVSDAFTAWAKEPGNLFRLSAFSVRSGEDVKTAIFKDRETAERAIKRSGLSGKAIVFPEKRGVNRIVMSPSEAIAKGIWQGDGDKRITLEPDFASELVEKMGRANRRGAKVSVPWQFERAYDRRKALARIGIETPAEFRAALREFIGLREAPAAPDKVKELERAMVGRRNDGMDFFPTPESTADEMVAAADIQPGMRVLEPSAGMGHIAERIRAAGFEPDVVEMSGDRRELLEAKGFNVIGSDFTEIDPPAREAGPAVPRDSLVAAQSAARGEALSQMGDALQFYDRGDIEGAADMVERAQRVTEDRAFLDASQGLGDRLRFSIGGYDRIIMNPPFSDGRDIQHVRHAYELLKPGGRLVAIMGESAFTNQNKRATEFREWLDQIGGTEEKLDEGTFNDPSLPVNTSANARMVVIEKPVDATPLLSQAPAQPFYSALSRAIESVAMKQGTAGAWTQALKGMLASGKVKADEIEWTGLKDWLDLIAHVAGKDIGKHAFAPGEFEILERHPGGKITKKQIAEYLAANGVQVTETVLGNELGDSIQRLREDRDATEAKLDRLGFEMRMEYGEAILHKRVNGMDFVFEDGEFVDEDGEPLAAIDAEARDLAMRYGMLTDQMEQASENPPSGSAKYAQYSLPGGTNYREVLLTLPTPAEDPRLAGLRERALAIEDMPETQERTLEQESELKRLRDEIRAIKGVQPAKYKSSHWDQPNVLAHIRLNDRTDADGKRVLFVEEIQSDWGQAGKKQGFDDAAKLKQRKVLEDEADVLREEGNEIHRGKSWAQISAADSKRLNEIDRRLEAIQREIPLLTKIPSAPFVTHTDKWLALALKRIVKMAVDEGYDKVAFVNGEQSAERYDLSKQVRSIEWTGRGNDTEKQVTITPNSGNDIEFKVQPDGSVGGMGGGSTGNEFDGKRLDEIVGKDVAERILGETHGDMRGNGLKVGGTGMVAFYDKIVPAALKDVLKKVGGEGQTSVSVQGESKYEKQFKSKAEAEAWAEANLGDHAYRVYGASSASKTFAIYDEFTNRPVPDVAQLTQPGFDITPAMRSKAADGLPLFKSTASTTGTDPGKLTDMVANIRAGWADAPPVTVVGTVLDLPIKLLTELRRANAMNTARALIIPNTGQVYLIADRLGSLADAQFVLFHEVLGHYGLRKFLGADYEKTMRQMRAMNAGLAAESRSWMAEYGPGQIEARVKRGMSYAEATVEVDLLSVEEALSDRAGKPEQISGFKRLVAKLQAWLREHGFMEVAQWLEGKTQAQVLSLLQSARDAVEKAEGVHAYTEPAAALLSQADQTDTPAFKRWFGASKVVDAEGKPLVVYHGTDKDFSAFDITKMGDGAGHTTSFAGFFFSADATVAGDFPAVKWEGWPLKRAALPGQNLMPVYLSITNPLTMTAKEFQQKWVRNKASGLELRAEAIDAGHDGIRITGDPAMAERMGGEEYGADAWVAFRPEQIKSALGNSGAFDPSNPSILLSQIDQGNIPGTTDTEQEAIARGYKARVKRALKRADGVINGLGELPDTEQYLGQRYLALGKIAAVDKIAGDIRAAFRKASQADKKEIYAYLTTAGANTDAIADPETKTMAAKVKRYIGTVGDQLVARGLISEESREAYRDAYLPRLYLAHLLSDGDWRAIGAGKKVSDMGYLKARKDIPQEIRDVILGEVKDPAFLAATAIAKPMRDMALLDWLAQISENQQWVLANSMTEWNGKRVSVFWLKAEADALRTRARHYPEAANRTAANAVAERMDAAAIEAMDGADFNHKDYKQIPNQPKYGRLRGIYVRAEIYNDLMGAQEFLPSDPGWAMHLLGYGGLGTKATQLWKMSKVALNIPGQVRNAISNGVMLQLSGVPFHKLPILMGRAISQIRHGGRHWLVAKKYGVTESTFQAQEMFRARRDLLDLERDLKGLTPLVALKTVGAVIADAAGDAYQFTEALFKTVKIMDAMEREGMDEEAAAIEAQKWLFDYSLVDKNVRYLRNAPVGMPFLTYTTKVLPRLAEVALLHPQRFLPWVALMYGMQAWAQAMFGGDDDEWDELKKALPKWMQEKGHVAFLPWRDDAGRLQAVDMSYFFPWSQWAEFGRSLTEGDLKGAGRAMGLFGGPVTSVITAYATGEDSFTGRQIINEGDPTSYQAASLLAYTWDLMMPPMMGSSGVVSPMWLLDPQYGGKLAQASTGATNRMGDQKATYGQAASRIAGFNAYGIDPEVTRTSNLIGMKADIAKARAALRSKLGNQGLTPTQQKKLIEDYTAEMAKRAKEMQKYAEESTVPDFARRQKVTE